MIKFKLNQRVYCRLHQQYGIITKISDKEGAYYPITVSFGLEIERTFTADGRYICGQKIYLSIPPIEEKINKLLKI